jgi:hypothetical protein
VAGRTIPFRLYAQILIFSGLIALGVMILMPIQRAIQGGMIGVRDDLITRLERQVDRKIRYSAISPSFFGSFDVRNVSIMGHDEHPVLTMSRFSVAYSLLDLLRGRVQAIHTVRIDTPFVDLNTARDHDLIELLKNLSNNGEGGSQQHVTAQFPAKLMVRIRNGKCLVFDGRDRFGLDALNLNVEIAGRRMILDGRWDIGITIDTLIGEPVSLYAATRVSGSCRTDMEEGEAVLSVPAITGDARSANPIAFGFALEDNVLRVGKMPDNLPFDFSLAYWLDEGKIDARLECADFRLRELFSFSGGLEGARQLLDIASSGEASFERGDDGSLGYAVNLAGRVTDARLSHPQTRVASYEINAQGDEQYAHVNTLRFSFPAAEEGADAFFFGDLRFSGGIGLDPVAPDGILSLRNFSRSGKNGLNADIAISTRDSPRDHTREGVYGREITVSCDALNWGSAGLSAFNALLQPAENDLGFTISAWGFTDMETAPNGSPRPDRSLGRAGSLSLEGNIRSPSRRIEAYLSLDSFSAGDLAGMTLPFAKNTSVPVPLRGMLDNTIITTEISFATDFTHIAYNAPRFDISNRAGRGFTAFASLSGTERSFELSGGRFTWGEDTLLLLGKAEFANSADLRFLINIYYRDLDYYVEGDVLDGKSVNIQGSYGLNVNLRASGNGFTGSMHAERFPAPFLGQPAFCSFSARLRYDSGASWSMNLEQFELANIAGPAGLAQIRVSGSADQNGADFPVLYYRDSLGPLSGRAGVSWESGYSAINGTAIVGDGTENYQAGCSFVDNRYNLVFSGSSMRLDRVFRGVKAVANGDLRLSWDSSASFRAEANLYSVTGKLYGQELGAAAHAVLENGGLSARGTFSFAGIQGEIPYFLINGEEGMAETRAAIQGLAGDKPIEGSLLLTADFKPFQSWFNIKEILNGVSGKVHVDRYRYGIGGQVQVFDIDFSRSRGAFAVSGGPRNMIRFQMDQDGSFYGGLSSPFPVRGTIIGTIDKRTISATCGDLYVDLGELFNLLPESPQFYLTGGYVNASVDIKGSLTDPEFFGSARATSVRVKIPGFVREELRPIPFNIVIDGNEIRFGPTAVAVGNGAGAVNGLFFFDRWIPNTFSIDITVPRETPIPYGFDISGFVARGDTAGNLNVSMENLTFDVSGELYANNTEMGINHDEMAGPGSAGLFSQTKIPFVVNLTVSTGPVVEFYYPSSRLPILRANPDIGTRLRVTADSLAQQYSLTSDIRIRSGEIFYFERSFYIRSGTLVFRENELRFAPRLTARAEIRDRTEDGPVTISMIVDNAPLLSFTARFESTPSLSQMEILALLGQNIAGNQFGEDTDAAWRAAASSITDLMAQFYMVRRLERVVRNLTRLDMFSFRTQALQNAFLMSTGLMQMPVDRNVGLGNYFDNTTVFGGKYIGQDMFIQGMLSMRYEGERGVTFSPDIGFELQNPLFSIRWDFVPTHPENWYISDNSITLTKSWSF